MKKSLTPDPRLVKADALLDKAKSTAQHIKDPITQEAVDQLVSAIQAIRAVLVDWEADENGWKRPSDGG